MGDNVIRRFWLTKEDIVANFDLPSEVDWINWQKDENPPTISICGRERAVRTFVGCHFEIFGLELEPAEV